jgi:LacI family transcriptional regulator
MSAGPTMNDVAHEAGVALKTVSRYVNGATNIHPDLAERIGAAIARLGYRRNMAAASIRPGRSSMVLGLIIGDLANPYYSQLTRAVESFAHEQGYLLVTASSEEDSDRHDRLVDRMIEQRVDGLMIVPPRDPGRPWASLAEPLPELVFLDRPVPGFAADTVLADNRGGARSAVAALLADGATRIAFVGDSLGIYTMRERYDGYKAALRSARIRLDPTLVLDGAHDDEQAAQSVRVLVQEAGADAVFAANNRSAVGALAAFRRIRRRVRLVGFDDFEAAVIVRPEVSVVQQDIEAMGRAAAGMLIDKIGGTRSEPRTLVLPTRLVLRGSERG